MKTKMKTFVSMIAILCLLAASLTGCGSTTVTEVVQTSPMTDQEGSHEQPHGDRQSKEKSKMESEEITEEDIAAILQAGVDAIAEESNMWAVSEITDADVIIQLMQSTGGRNQTEGEGFPRGSGDSPNDEGKQRPDGEMPEGTMPERSGENRPENMDGSFPDGEKTEGGQGRGEGGGRQSGNRGGMISLAIVISGTENTTLEAEDIFTQIQLAAEELGYESSSMELTEEQQSVIEVPDGYSVKMVVLIDTQMSEMETGEAVG